MQKENKNTNISAIFLNAGIQRVFVIVLRFVGIGCYLPKLPYFPMQNV